MECSGKSQKTRYLALTTVLRARYNYPPSLDEAQRGLSKVTEGVKCQKARIPTLLLGEVSRGSCPWSSRGERQNVTKARKVFRIRVILPPGWRCDLRGHRNLLAGPARPPYSDQWTSDACSSTPQLMRQEAGRRGRGEYNTLSFPGISDPKLLLDRCECCRHADLINLNCPGDLLPGPRVSALCLHLPGPCPRPAPGPGHGWA